MMMKDDERGATLDEVLQVSAMMRTDGGCCFVNIAAKSVAVCKLFIILVPRPSTCMKRGHYLECGTLKARIGHKYAVIGRTGTHTFDKVGVRHHAQFSDCRIRRGVQSKCTGKAHVYLITNARCNHWD